jgi:acetyltransferase-like isoleucine patch superfamily enzyme
MAQIESLSSRPLVEELGDPQASPYRRYMELFVGKPSFGAFLRYELLTGMLGPLHGAAGYFLRSQFYGALFKRLGRGSILGKGVTLRAPGNISLGARVLIDDYAVLDAKGARSSIELGDRILVGRNTILSCSDSRIRVGDGVSIGPFCFFASKSFIDVGSNVSIGSGTHLMAGTHATDDPDAPIIQQARLSKGITVEDNVWIGSGAKVLDGVRVGRNSIVGAGAVVSQDVPPWMVVLGNPARVVQRRKPVDAASPAAGATGARP